MMKLLDDVIKGLPGIVGAPRMLKDHIELVKQKDESEYLMKTLNEIVEKAESRLVEIQKEYIHK